ncbi:nucleotidyl transferase AbiEii/AbiGii toxin family protein [Mucilaginibacter conchicola]|uniref:Nucleotidyl transferase AbiEii/AbiGii toxin family protein n=1 Tax=Mucilaginibacter conchicola TaxID=2303333 RepID=A0A372NQL9_9SPHI|nr:nucleotidyl transferase AbiEii/AbiGii toxin family protein [Mucilaginibacter conchicola]RFZ91231.1 nucleotidyl transferase AbiEii/AbiGii toxin family protein [Mucilaginibacter conchicola]
MGKEYLHERKDFKNLLLTLEGETGILAPLIEKDYWIMHVLHSLKTDGLNFELKGGTSLSKGYKIIDRFSEDIDLHISPPEAFKTDTGLDINENPKSSNKNHFNPRRQFFDWLANHIKVKGIMEIVRDTAFDDPRNYRSGGIRLIYKSHFDTVWGIKDGILLEVGFAKVTPNSPVDISSWAYDRAMASKIDIDDNRAIAIPCYHAGYTLVEKLQTIATKFRVEQSKENEDAPKVNFMRQYYDIFQLLHQEDVLAFIGTEEYFEHKKFHFPEIDLNVAINDNEAFKLSDESIRKNFRSRYMATSALYYQGQPDFDEMISYLQPLLTKL